MQRLAEQAQPQRAVTVGARRSRPDRRAARRADRSGEWRHARRAEISAALDLRAVSGAPACAPGEGRFFALVELTLERMAQGGIYDHLGGGFSRYSVDERWLVPHFEKMLYDNAQLLELLAFAWSREPESALPAARAGDRRLA